MKKRGTNPPLATVFGCVALDRGKPAGGIAEPLQVLHSKAVAHAEVEVAHWLASGLIEPAALERAAAAASEDDREIVVGVAVAIGIAAAINDHGVIQQRSAVHVFRFLELLEKAGELFHVPAVDIGHPLDHVFLALVMRKVVMPLGDADFRVGAVVAIARKQEGGDTATS